MQYLRIIFLIVSTFLIISCDTDTELISSEEFDAETSSLSDRSAGSAIAGTGSGQNNQSGLITAGEWNDLDNWEYWLDIINGDDHADKSNYWGFYLENRISILLSDSNNQAIVDADVQLKQNRSVIWESKTDNYGKAEILIDMFQPNQRRDISEYSLFVNGQKINNSLKFFDKGINEITLNHVQETSNRVELSFIVDATSSMHDELEFLKDDLSDVIRRVKRDNSSSEIYTSSVFYRDEGDEYIIRKSNFSDNSNNTLRFIKDQSAEGGGDFPEAVHTAMQIGIEELKWSDSAKTRIAFLLLDAPPHYKSEIVEDLQNYIEDASRKGIKVIPITASGIDKETEFLMRFFAISTNSTYVFITDDSGIGNDHLEPTVGDFEVEFLNDLMVRLINKYTQ